MKGQVGWRQEICYGTLDGKNKTAPSLLRAINSKTMAAAINTSGAEPVDRKMPDCAISTLV